MDAIIIVFAVLLSTESYKQGQIDAMTGLVKYKLTTQPDSTKTWEHIQPK